MDQVLLARWQFGITTVYHFFFVPLTLGLSILIAILETIYVRTGNETYKRMVKFWGKLFVINFAMGVVTGIVQEFQFGMNWSEYSRFVGDVFGVPLAIEALSSFFLESTFLGIWIFGWDRLSRGKHAAAAWLVAIGSNLSALWILIANSFMHEPVGYIVDNGRARLTDFGALITNPHLGYQYFHVLASGVVTAAFFVLAISAYHLLKKSPDLEAFRRSFRAGAVYALVGTVLVIVLGHSQAQHMVQAQPMKMAAAEALWQSEDPAGLSLFSLFDENKREEIFSIRIPALLSFLAYNAFTGRVEGINDLQAAYEARFGPGNYVPPVALNYWSFRIMVGVGFLMLLLALIGVYLVIKGRLERTPWYLKILLPAVLLPYLANTTGWLLTEVGRQPWIVFGLLQTADAASPAVTGDMVLFSLVLFTVLYGVLMLVDIYLLVKFARAGTTNAEETAVPAVAY